LLNERLLRLAEWLDTHAWSTALHESYYLYNWIESTHVLTLALFLGMLCAIDLRMLGWAFTTVPASTIAKRLDKPMLIGFAVMVASGLMLYYAIPVRTTNSIWFRVKVVLMIAAAINALLFRHQMKAAANGWDSDAKPPSRVRLGAAVSLALWSGVVATGRLMAYDWYDCQQIMPHFMYWLAGCAPEMALLE
jgi:hypothetical protein